MPNRVLHLDFETYSENDLKGVGLENYIADPGFTVTVIAWAFDKEPVQSQQWPAVSDLPAKIIAHIRAGGEIRAHNAAFEYAVLVDHYGVKVAVEQMTCTMQKALAYGLPGGLLKAGLAIKAPHLKDETKRNLMLQMGRPRKNGLAPWHTCDPAKLAELEEYCRNDVTAERSLDSLLPDLHPFEKRLSELDAKINRRGVKIDRGAVSTLRTAAGVTLNAINSECAKLTGGAVTSPGTQTARLVAWLDQQGCPVPDVSKETIEVMLKDPDLSPYPAARRVLELRQMAARSSVAKLDKMLEVAGRDDRARNLLQFYGAGRTGRWAGRLIQPQNLPRPNGIKTDHVIGLERLGALSMMYSDPMQAISRALRGCFVAEPGKVLVSVDLSQIEARVLAWIAGQADVLKAFAQGDDVYVLQAAKVGSNDRQLGKVLTLACGYGMGWAKFQETAAKAPYYVTLTAAEAQSHLRTWRDLNGAITGLWGEVERIVRLSLMISNLGRVLDLPRGMKVRTLGGVTQIRKPNGVKLTYHRMRLSNGELLFDGVNGKTKQWGVENAYGGRLIENIVQSVARDVMAEAMLAEPDDLVMSVHDEIVWEKLEQLKFMWTDRLTDVVNRGPAWARGLPIASEPHVGFRYGK